MIERSAKPIAEFFSKYGDRGGGGSWISSSGGSVGRPTPSHRPSPRGYPQAAIDTSLNYESILYQEPSEVVWGAAIVRYYRPYNIRHGLQIAPPLIIEL